MNNNLSFRRSLFLKVVSDAFAGVGYVEMVIGWVTQDMSRDAGLPVWMRSGAYAVLAVWRRGVGLMLSLLYGDAEWGLMPCGVEMRSGALCRACGVEMRSGALCCACGVEMRSGAYAGYVV